MLFPPRGSIILGGRVLISCIGDPFELHRKINNVMNPKNIKINCILSVATMAENQPFHI